MSTESKDAEGAAQAETSADAGRAENLKTITVEEMQAEIDRRVTAAVGKTKAKADAERAEREKALLAEQGKYQELAEATRKEAEDAKAKLAQYERGQHIDKLLNEKAEKNPLLKEPGVRELFHRMNGDAPDVLAVADGLHKSFAEAVESEVTRRLGTDKPAKSEPKKSAGSLIEQIREAENKGEWALSFDLKNKLEEQRRTGVSP
jgi:hypothetical protein